jgi:Auxiliary Activity family 9 (formerly GH61)
MTKNAQGKNGVENPTSPDIRCYTSQTAANVATVPAGSTVHYVSSQQINHPGPTQYYLAKVPGGSSATTFDGSGEVWFKFHTEMPIIDKNKQLSWPGQSKNSYIVPTLPT